MLNGVSFDNLTLVGTNFDQATLDGATFHNAVLRNVSFKTELKKVNFDGARMDKLTYALLKSQGAKLSGVTLL